MGEDGFDDSGAPPVDFPTGFDGGGDSPGIDAGGGGGMTVDPTTGDVYDEQGNFVGNIDDPQFGGPGLGSTYGGGGGGGSMASLLKMLGLGGGGAGSLLPLLSAVGIGAGAYMNNKATNKATGQMTDAVKQANDAITKILGGAQGAYQPYIDMGGKAAAGLSALPAGSIAGNFGDIGSKFGPLGNLGQRPEVTSRYFGFR